MLPGWQRWMKLHRTCFYTPDVTRLAAIDEARSHMLLHTGCYQVRSDGRKLTLVTLTPKCACRSRTSPPPPSQPGPSGAATWPRQPTLCCDLWGSDLGSCGQRSPPSAGSSNGGRRVNQTLCNGVSCYIPPMVARTQMCPNAGRTRVRATKN